MSASWNGDLVGRPAKSAGNSSSSIVKIFYNNMQNTAVEGAAKLGRDAD